MSGELKRAFYRIFIMLIALFFKILIIQDVFMFIARLVFGYNEFSSVLYIVLAAATVGIVVGKSMVAKEKNDPKARRLAVEYFTEHPLTRKESSKYIFKVNGEKVFNHRGVCGDFEKVKSFTVGYVSGAYLNGVLDDFGLFSAPLTPAEAKKIFSANAPLNTIYKK